MTTKRCWQTTTFYAYDHQAVLADNYAMYNFPVGAYTVSGLTGPYYGQNYVDPLPAALWSADALAGAGVR